MMKIYARIDNGIVQEIILPAPPYDTEAPNWQEGDPSRIGTERPIEVRFPASFVAALVDITDIDPLPGPNWSYDGTTFLPYAPPQMTPAEILYQNQVRQAAFKTNASIAMTPYVLSLNLGDATDAETLLAKAWQSYYRELDLVDITVAEPAWPAAPA